MLDRSGGQSLPLDLDCKASFRPVGGHLAVVALSHFREEVGRDLLPGGGFHHLLRSISISSRPASSRGGAGGGEEVGKV